MARAERRESVGRTRRILSQHDAPVCKERGEGVRRTMSGYARERDDGARGAGRGSAQNKARLRTRVCGERGEGARPPASRGNLRELLCYLRVIGCWRPPQGVRLYVRKSRLSIWRGRSTSEWAKSTFQVSAWLFSNWICCGGTESGSSRRARPISLLLNFVNYPEPNSAEPAWPKQKSPSVR